MRYLQSYKEHLLNKGHTEAEASEVIIQESTYFCSNCGESNNSLSHLLVEQVAIDFYRTTYNCNPVILANNQNKLVTWLNK